MPWPIELILPRLFSVHVLSFHGNFDGQPKFAVGQSRVILALALKIL